MDSGFNDPIKAHPKPKCKPSGFNDPASPWKFGGPGYDERSSCFLNAGTDYGVGYRNPVGSEKMKTGEPAPRGRVKTLKVSDRY